MVRYCIYCGQDEDKGHYDDCPLVKGIPQAVLGIRPVENDIEYNLNLGRVAQLTCLRKRNGKMGIGTGDEKRDRLLKYEQIAFLIRRLIPQLRSAQEESKKKIRGVFARKKLKDINKTIDDIYEQAKQYNIPKEEIDKLWHQNIMLANFSVKDCIPFYRDPKTMRLDYQPVE